MIELTSLSCVLIVAAQNHLSKTTLGDDDDDESDAEPGLSDYVMHYLTLPWKVSPSMSHIQ